MYCFKISKERSNDRHIGRNWSDGHTVFINIQSQIGPINTARTYCTSVSNGQWMEDPHPQSMWSIDDAVAASHHIRTYASMRQIHSSSSPLLDSPWYWCRQQTMRDLSKKIIYWPCKLHYICMHYLTYFSLSVFEPHINSACIYRHKVTWYFFFIYHHIFRPRNNKGGGVHSWSKTDHVIFEQPLTQKCTQTSFNNKYSLTTFYFYNGNLIFFCIFCILQACGSLGGCWNSMGIVDEPSFVGYGWYGVPMV